MLEKIKSKTTILTHYQKQASGIPILAWRHARARLEELIEYRLVRKIKSVDHFLDGHIRILEKILGLKDDIGVYPVRS